MRHQIEAAPFCTLCGVQQRDIGYGGFYSPATPAGGEGATRGFAIFDTTYGSLRLTRQLVERMDEVLEEAQRLALEAGATRIALALAKIAETLAAMPSQPTGGYSDVLSIFLGGDEGDWIGVIAPEQPAMLYDGAAHQGDEVRVVRYMYTPQGLRYELQSPKPGVKLDDQVFPA